ncbi:MAG TPA: hypothetical protein PLV12_00735 [Saprospiraceae bacterium]|nr:hypothetical protein [Saprospiraceae bacterium]
MSNKYLIIGIMVAFNLSSCSKDQKKEQTVKEIALKTRSGCPDSEEGIDCEVKWYGPDTFIVNGCPHIVLAYRVIECPDGFTIDNMSWYRDQTSSCDSLEQTWETAGLGTASLGFEQTVRQLTLEVQNHMIGIFYSQSKYQCSNAGSNPCSNLTYAAGFSMSGCYNLCWYREGEDLNIYESECGQGCCKRVTPFCIKRDGEICYGTPVITSVANCGPVDIDCGENSGPTNEDACRHACNKL